MILRWVSFEGIEGVGKTYLASQLARRLGHRCLPAEEITDHAADSVPGAVVTAMSRTGDVFLRTGHPLTETFALLALKVREYEQASSTAAQCPEVRMIVEDRGIDTVAVYQAIILAGVDASLAQLAAMAGRIDNAATLFRPPADLTVLLCDDLDACLNRFERRLGVPLPLDAHVLVTRAAELYTYRATRQPARYRIIDRAGRTETDVVDLLHEVCVDLMKAAVPGPAGEPELEHPCET